MLQAVLGLDAVRVARAFLVTPTAMSQRLVRAKQKIRDAGISFDEPEPAALSGRMASVYEAIYAAFAVDYDELEGEAGVESIAEEAIYLARVVSELAFGESIKRTGTFVAGEALQPSPRVSLADLLEQAPAWRSSTPRTTSTHVSRRERVARDQQPITISRRSTRTLPSCQLVRTSRVAGPSSSTATSTSNSSASER